MKEFESDCLVSCPIVCGGYMSATGFFYSTGETTYLITARHNCLPTNGKKLKTGDKTANFQTKCALPSIDIYLRTSNGFDVKRVDITEQDGIVQTKKLDVLCVPIDWAPNKYGYKVYEESDTTAPQQAGTSVKSIGFNEGFPENSDEYDIEMYRNQIAEPFVLSLENEIAEKISISTFGLMPHAIDADFVGNDDDYNGLSGAPIIGSGLIGIHSQNNRLSADVLKENGLDEFVTVSYTRADVLPKLL